MSYLPSTLIVSCTSKHPSEVVKLILQDDAVPQAVQLEEGVFAYPWHLDTKYYETDVYLCTIESKALVSQQMASTVEAVIVYFDSTANDALINLEGWLPFVKSYEVDIQILLCRTCKRESMSGVSKLIVQEWCVRKGFELVELEPELDEEWEVEQDFVESTGIARVVQALQAHIWPNLTMKERKEPTSFKSLLNGGGPSECLDRTDLAEEMEDLQLTSLDQDVNMEQRIEELLGGGGVDMEFSQLFERLREMKERVAALPSEERKACAEQVVLAFWQAIGGQEDDEETEEMQSASQEDMS